MKPAYIILTGVVVIGAGYLLVRHWKKQWHKTNAPLGKELGYPDCCVKAFSNDTPHLLKIKGVLQGVSTADRMRYEASLLNGKYTGFIPCAAHAKKILNGEIELKSLITNRNPDFPPFPDFK